MLHTIKQTLKILMITLMVLIHLQIVQTVYANGTDTTTQEVVIDLAQGWGAVPGVYNVDGSGMEYIHLYNPNVHYIIKNRATRGCYIYVGESAFNKKVPGVYNVTLENAYWLQSQWNNAAFNVIAGATANVELVGSNNIVGRENWVNTRPVVCVEPTANLVIQGNGSLDVATSTYNLKSAGIGGDGGDNFGNIIINSGKVYVGVSYSAAKAAIGGNGNGNIEVHGGRLTVYGGNNSPAIETTGTGKIIIDGANTTVVANGYGNNAGIQIGRNGTPGGNNGEVVIRGGATVVANGGASGSGIGTGATGSAGNVTIEGAQTTVTATGGVSGGYGIHGASVAIDVLATVRAYASGNYAIAAGSATGTGNIVNAYYTNNGTKDTFAPFSTTAKTVVQGGADNVSVPANYTSFAYNAPSGAYAHSYIDSGKKVILVQLDGTETVAAAQNLQPVPLTKGVPNEVTVTFNSQGGSAVAPVVVNKNSLLVKPTDPTYVGYVFGGWFKDAAGKTPWNFSIDRVTTDITLFAKWQTKNTGNEYTVVFESNGGTPVPSQQVKEGGLVLKVTAPKRDGYCFGGWFVDESFSKMWNFTKNGVYSDMTLYALWHKCS